MIDSYSFGRISIDGRLYHKDVIILPGGAVISPWWRQTGHQVVLSDLESIVDAAPRILVIGSGDSGLMKPHASLEDELKARGIQAEVLPTRKAVQKYNALTGKSEPVAACFHLTC